MSGRGGPLSSGCYIFLPTLVFLATFGAEAFAAAALGAFGAAFLAPSTTVASSTASVDFLREDAS